MQSTKDCQRGRKCFIIILMRCARFYFSLCKNDIFIYSRELCLFPKTLLYHGLSYTLINIFITKNFGRNCVLSINIYVSEINSWVLLVYTRTPFEIFFVVLSWYFHWGNEIVNIFRFTAKKDILCISYYLETFTKYKKPQYILFFTDLELLSRLLLGLHSRRKSGRDEAEAYRW